MQQQQQQASRSARDRSFTTMATATAQASASYYSSSSASSASSSSKPQNPTRRRTRLGLGGHQPPFPPPSPNPPHAHDPPHEAQSQSQSPSQTQPLSPVAMHYRQLVRAAVTQYGVTTLEAPQCLFRNESPPSHDNCPNRDPMDPHPKDHDPNMDPHHHHQNNNNGLQGEAALAHILQELFSPSPERSEPPPKLPMIEVLLRVGYESKWETDCNERADVRIDMDDRDYHSTATATHSTSNNNSTTCTAAAEGNRNQNQNRNRVIVHTFQRESLQRRLCASPLYTLAQQFPQQMQLIPLLHNPEQQRYLSIHHPNHHHQQQERFMDSLAVLQQLTLLLPTTTTTTRCPTTFGTVSNGLVLPESHPLHLPPSWIVEAVTSLVGSSSSVSSSVSSSMITQLPVNVFEPRGLAVARYLQSSLLSSSSLNHHSHHHHRVYAMRPLMGYPPQQQQQPPNHHLEEEKVDGKEKRTPWASSASFSTFLNQTSQPWVLADFLIPAAASDDDDQEDDDSTTSIITTTTTTTTSLHETAAAKEEDSTNENNKNKKKMMKMKMKMMWTHQVLHETPEVYTRALKTSMQHFDAEALIQVKLSDARALTVEERETLDGCKLLQSLFHDLDAGLALSSAHDDGFAESESESESLSSSQSSSSSTSPPMASTQAPVVVGGGLRSWAQHEAYLLHYVIPLIRDTFETYDAESASVLERFFAAYSVAVRHALARNTRRAVHHQLQQQLQQSQEIIMNVVPSDMRLQEFALRFVLQEPSIECVVVSATDASQMLDNDQILERYFLQNE